MSQIGKQQLLKEQEICAIAKMTARCALYKWIEWAVAEIWPLEIIQDGGLSPTWIWCSAIRSADPENPELNVKCIGSPVAEIWPFTCLAVLGQIPCVKYLNTFLNTLQNSVFKYYLNTQILPWVFKYFQILSNTQPGASTWYMYIFQPEFPDKQQQCITAPITQSH